MAQQPSGQDLLTKLADAGEQMIGRISDLPGAKPLVESMHTMRERLDEVQKKLRGVDELEKRVKQLEKRVKALEGGDTGTKSRSAPRKSPAKASSAKPKPAS